MSYVRCILGAHFLHPSGGRAVEDAQTLVCSGTLEWELGTRGASTPTPGFSKRSAFACFGGVAKCRPGSHTCFHMLLYGILYIEII